MAIFADSADVVKLTGFKQFKKQREHLKAEKIKFILSAKGEPCVPISEVNRILGLNKEKKRTVKMK